MTDFEWSTLCDGEWSGTSDFVAIILLTLVIAFVRVYLDRR